MATTPEGTPYVESSDLVANYPAASLALANRVDVVGVLPFADATARDAAITSPTDGQYVYLQDTNTTQFYNGAAWQTAGQTPGLHLVTPTSIANSGGSASATGGAVTFTGVTNISLNGVFTSAFANYKVIIKTTASATGITSLRGRVGGTDTSTSIYHAQQFEAFGTTLSAARNVSQTLFRIGANRISELNFYNIDFFGPQIAEDTQMQSTNGLGSATTTPEYFTAIGGIEAATQFDGFTIIPNVGNLTGTIRVYGYQNS